ncbi:HAD-IA family hydrolase [Priestia filamentosa]|uniref:HAD-IA family hydrolase n=1 Tax=Priestia filamentosa TaxID=1402861 RepID=UPI002894FB44|nr:HAD-IA family hydrolase [Priestia filamentosa]MDT3766171.1 HAD-IA family hydrolase [Priestia filamentosa]
MKMDVKRKMIKTVICDFDGTIVDSAQLVYDLFNKFSDKYNYDKMPQEEMEYIRSITFKERFKQYNVSFIKVPRLVMDVVKEYKKSVPFLKVNMEMKEVLKDLKNKGIKLVLISANSKENIEKFLKLNDMEYFDEIIRSNRFFGRNLTVNRFMKSHHLHNEETILIGDEHRDIVAAKKSHIKVISVTWGYDLKDLLVSGKPDFLVEDPKEILEVIHR